MHVKMNCIECGQESAHEVVGEYPDTFDDLIRIVTSADSAFQVFTSSDLEYFVCCCCNETPEIGPDAPPMLIEGKRVVWTDVKKMTFKVEDGL